VDLVWAELNNAIGTEIYIETKASEWGNNFISIVKPPSTGPTVKQATKKVEVKKEPEPEKQAILDDDENIPF
jgi:hypothetical protein